MEQYSVEFSENNSGGSWWLNEAQCNALESAGWIYNRTSTIGNHRAAAHKTFAAASEDEALDTAIAEWERITGENSNTLGCSCCGRPFNFYVYPEGVPDV